MIASFQTNTINANTQLRIILKLMVSLDTQLCSLARKVQSKADKAKTKKKKVQLHGEEKVGNKAKIILGDSCPPKVRAAHEGLAKAMYACMHDFVNHTEPSLSLATSLYKAAMRLRLATLRKGAWSGVTTRKGSVALTLDLSQDRNNDDIVDKGEAMDLNNDGRVTEAEMLAADAKREAQVCVHAGQM